MITTRWLEVNRNISNYEEKIRAEGLTKGRTEGRTEGRAEGRTEMLTQVLDLLERHPQGRRAQARAQRRLVRP